MMVSCIVAMSENQVIGRSGDLPWHLPADLKRFKRLTMGHHIIMGRKTWDSIGRPLPGRTSVVVSRDGAFAAPGASVVTSIDGAIEFAAAAGDDEPFVIGGAAIYDLALPRIGRLHLTWVHAIVEGDVFFPELDLAAWELVTAERHEADARHAYAYSWCVYERRSAAVPSPSAKRTTS